MPLPARRAVRPTALLAVAAVSAGLVFTTSSASSAQPATAPEAQAAQHKRVGPPTVTMVTLVTGDVVKVSTSSDGRQSVTLQPRPDGSIPQAAIQRAHGHVYVVPSEALGLLEANRLDHDLFDVTALIGAEYDDTSRQSLPVMVDYGKGRTAAQESRTSSLEGAERTVTVPRLGIAAFHAEKEDARAFWADLTKGQDAAGNPTALADGAARVYLDGRVEVALEDSVPQIHAPEAWAAGYDGAGSTVAVLDTGYDPTHPDLQGRVVASANFTSDAAVTDGNGHGTHVASTVGGTGAASGGLRKGVAPKTGLMVGKVLSDGGWGEDSWVLAGMVWAVNEGADVVSMSLGGDTDDGSEPAGSGDQRAVRQLGQPVRRRRRQQRRQRAVHRHGPRLGRRGPDRGCRRRQRRDGRLLQPWPALPERGAQARGGRTRRRRDRRPRRRHGARPDRRRGLHDHQRHLDGHPARGRSGRHDQAAAPRLGRRADQVGHRQQHRVRGGRDRLRRRHRTRGRHGRDQPGRPRPGIALPGLLRVALLGPRAEQQGPDLHQHREHTRDAVAGPHRPGRLGGADRLHARWPATRSRCRPAGPPRSRCRSTPPSPTPAPTPRS